MSRIGPGRISADQSSESAAALPAAELALVPSYTLAGLPPAGTAGRRARVTDGVRGLATDLGDQWLLENAVRGIPVEWFGTKGDGVTDDTTAITNAIAQVPEGSVLRFRPVTYLFSNLVVNRRVKLAGSGWFNSANAVFGDASWTTATNHGGTILKSTATTGNALKLFISGSSGASGFGMSDILLLGPGSGTSTGLLLGESSNVSLVQGVFQNILIANFSTGATIFALDSTFRDFRVRGSSTGISLGGDSNQNVFVNTEVQFSTVDAILITMSRGNLFVGGLIQNAINKGIRTAADAYGNHFFGWWLENTGAITQAVDFASGPQCTFADSLVVKGDISVNVPDCRIENVRSVANATLTIGASGVGVVIINSEPSGAFTNNSPSIIRMHNSGIRTEGLDSGIVIGGGTRTVFHASNSSILSFGTITANDADELTFTLTGAVVGDTAYTSPNGDPGSNLIWSARVSAANTVAVRLANVSTANVLTTDRTWRVDIWRH